MNTDDHEDDRNIKPPTVATPNKIERGNNQFANLAYESDNEL